MSKKLIFGKKQVSEQFFGGENMSKKMSSRPSRVYTGFRAKNMSSRTSSLHAREFSQNSHILGPTQAKIIVYS